jgi:hypothetical protein
MTATMSGPLFDGRLTAVVAGAVDQAEHDIADVGVNVVRNELANVLQHPTGHYQSEIQTERAVGDWAVTDGGIVYGPWLAGTSSRNQSTRFKGYSHWRRATQRLQQQAPGIAGHVIAQAIGGL